MWVSVMANYAKIWTDIFDDDWFLSLNCNHRGFWLQLIILAKRMGDTGQIICKSSAFLAHICSLDVRSVVRILEKFKLDGKLIVEKSSFGSMIVKIPNYKYWQEVRDARQSSQKKPESYKNAAKMSQDSTIPDQTRPNQTIDVFKTTSKKKKRKKPDTDHAKFIDYFCDKHKEKFGVEYQFIGGKDGNLVKSLLKAYKKDILYKMVDLFFEDDDKFLIKAGYTIGTFKIRANTLAQKQSGKLPKPNQPCERVVPSWEETH